MRKLAMIMLALAAILGVQITADAASNGTAEEAKALVFKAAAMFQRDGKDKTIQAVSDPAGAFVDRDLYIFVLTLDGTIIGHGANKALIGKSLIDLKDADGKAFFREFVAVGNGPGEGWVDYKWVNPTTKKVEAKSSLIKKVGDVLIGCGIYKG